MSTRRATCFLTSPRPAATLAVLGVAALGLAACGGPARTSPTVTSISVSLDHPMAPAGVPVTASITETLSDGTMRVGSAGNVTWSSSDDTIATNMMTSAPNVFVGLKAGMSATITATPADPSIAPASAMLMVTDADAVALTVSPPSATVPIGLTVPLTAAAEFTDGSTRDVTAMTMWSVDMASIATVGASTGVVTGVAGGDATVTAMFMGPSTLVTATVPIHVPSTTVSSVAVTPSAGSVPAGVSLPLTATATLSDGTVVDVTTAATWTTSDSGSATVDANGVVTGVAATTSPVTITATYGLQSGTAAVTVSSVTLTSLSVSPPSASVPVGGTQAFQAIGTFSDGSMYYVSSAMWSVSDSTVASIDATSGVATGLAAGSDTVTATSGSITATAALTVSAAALTSIAVTCPACATPASPDVAVGSTIQLAAQGGYSDGTKADVTSMATWDAAMPSVASVSDATASKGLVTGGTLPAGTTSATADISATVGSTTGSVTVTVHP